MAVTTDRNWRRLAEAEGYLTLGMAEKCLTILRTRVNWQSMPFESNLLAGLAYRELKDYQTAIQHLEKANRFKPDEMDISLALGWCYKRTNRLAQAIDALTRAVIRNKSEPLLHYNLACYWSLAGNVAHAVENLQKALKLAPQMIFMVPSETDFDPIRHDPVFQALMCLEAL
ncbi:tetratricopeptide repeat protein [bacterium]|nr:tetratricopeptide repeat protein [bacterium]